MQYADSVHYLEQAGFHFKPAESPDLWTHLESRFARGGVVGPKFAPMAAPSMAELIERGEETLLEALVEMHKRSGALGRVARVIELPYVVGTGAGIPLAKTVRMRGLRLIEQPGTPQERIVHLLPTAADDIPCTNRMTATGGLYADGRTAGYFDLYPGECAEGNLAELAYLATKDEIKTLAREMEMKMEEIGVVTRRECEGMIVKIQQMLGFMEGN